MFPIHAGMDTTAEIGFDNYLALTAPVLILGLAFACGIYKCCWRKLVACLRRKFGTERQGRENRRVDSGRNPQAEVDIPLQPLREVDASPCLSDRLPQEYRCVPRDEPPITTMEAN
ncbi:hypothetical protein CEXT_347081 [Caerostris extrusa]|uniref:Uncharacterized protein n=1 Tax=Caerostris extrusa TaxID=172846 RepID=A0AAV4V0G1_CAEEX|nr:hypothetical protein CEXT_347081 [Caerostris extrusa]